MLKIPTTFDNKPKLNPLIIGESAVCGPPGLREKVHISVKVVVQPIVTQSFSGVPEALHSYTALVIIHFY
jgi:hypothetical protein